MMGEARVATPQERLTDATARYNEALVRIAQDGHAVKLSIRTFPGIGNIAKCPQVKAEIPAAK